MRGYQKRSGIEVDLDIDGLTERLQVFSKRDHGTKVMLSVPYPFVSD
ncbi:MAG: hypothetical protein OEW09_04490 [Anaerolineae bacterium]|nr:hypothetical protein [Anaerolineae bacterium]